jgi:hypothetical protein
MNPNATKTFNDLADNMKKIKETQKRMETTQSIVMKHLMTLPNELQKLSTIKVATTYMNNLTNIKKNISHTLLSEVSDSDKLKTIQKILLQDTLDTNCEEVNTSVKNDVNRMLNEIFNEITTKIMKDLNDSEVTEDQFNAIFNEQKTQTYNDVINALIKSEDKYKQLKQNIVDVLKDSIVDTEKVNIITNYVI